MSDGLQECAVLLFQLPSDREKASPISAKFFDSWSFWKPFYGRLMLMAPPFSLSKTETPDGFPALVLFVDVNAKQEFLKEIAGEIAEALEVEAYTVLATRLDEAMVQELIEQEKPWEMRKDEMLH